MEFPTSQMQPTNSLPGNQREEPLNELEPISQSTNQSVSKPIISKGSQDTSKVGGSSNTHVLESLQCPRVAEEILGTEATPPRIWKLTSEDFLGWRQVLGAYIQDIHKQIRK